MWVFVCVLTRGAAQTDIRNRRTGLAVSFRRLAGMGF